MNREENTGKATGKKSESKHKAILEGAAERIAKKLDTWGEKYEEQRQGRRTKMSGFNRVVLMGNLTRDPELRKTTSGKPVGDIGLAVNEVYKNKEGEFAERACFVDVVVWGRQAEACAEYLKKGAPVLVEGRLQLDRWETSDGQKRSKHKITADSVQFLNGKKREPDNKQAEPALVGAGVQDDNAPF